VEQIIDQFTSAAESAGGQVRKAGNTQQVIQSVLEICAQEHARYVVIGPTRNVDQTQLSGALSEAHFESRTISEKGDTLEFLAHADVGITDALGGIANTGTLILATSLEAERLASALPRTHVALLSTKRLARNLEDIPTLIESLAAKSFPTISLVTGPSSTADIEQTLVKGVHGPHSLWVILVGE